MNRFMNPARLLVFFSVLMLAVPAQAAQQLDANEVRRVLKENPDIVIDVLRNNSKLIERALAGILKDNPNIILDVLRANNVEALEIAQSGAREKQHRQLVAQWEKDRTQPKKVNYDRPILGDPKAPVTIVAYSDFTCHFCAQADMVTKEVLAQRPRETRLIFKNFPKKDDPVGRLAAQYSKAAFLQDEKKGWAFNAAVFAGQEVYLEKGEGFLRETAGKVGLDIERLAADANSSKVNALLLEDRAEGDALGAPGTPFHLVNDLTIRGAAPLPTFLDAVDLALKDAGKRK